MDKEGVGGAAHLEAQNLNRAMTRDKHLQLRLQTPFIINRQSKLISQSLQSLLIISGRSQSWPRLLNWQKTFIKASEKTGVIKKKKKINRTAHGHTTGRIMFLFSTLSDSFISVLWMNSQTATGGADPPSSVILQWFINKKQYETYKDIDNDFSFVFSLNPSSLTRETSVLTAAVQQRSEVTRCWY